MNEEVMSTVIQKQLDIISAQHEQIAWLGVQLADANALKNSLPMAGPMPEVPESEKDVDNEFMEMLGNVGTMGGDSDQPL